MRQLLRCLSNLTAFNLSGCSSLTPACATLLASLEHLTCLLFARHPNNEETTGSAQLVNSGGGGTTQSPCTEASHAGIPAACDTTQPGTAIAPTASAGIATAGVQAADVDSDPAPCAGQGRGNARSDQFVQCASTTEGGNCGTIAAASRSQRPVPAEAARNAQHPASRIPSRPSFHPMGSLSQTNDCAIGPRTAPEQRSEADRGMSAATLAHSDGADSSAAGQLTGECENAGSAEKKGGAAAASRRSNSSASLAVGTSKASYRSADAEPVWAPHASNLIRNWAASIAAPPVDGNKLPPGSLRRVTRPSSGSLRSKLRGAAELDAVYNEQLSGATNHSEGREG